MSRPSQSVENNDQSIMDFAAVVQAYADEWAVVQWQTPVIPNHEFYTKWALFIELMTGIKGLESMCDMERYSIGYTVSVMLRQRAGITGQINSA